MPFYKPEEALDALVHAYYEERNSAAVLSCVTQDIEWIGTDNNDSASGKPALMELLKRDMADNPGSYRVAIHQTTAQHINGDAVLLTVVGEQTEIAGISGGLFVRGSVCCVRTEEGWLINHVHTSAPSLDKEKQALEREMECKLQRDMDRFHLVVDEMRAAVFEWDMKAGTFYHSAAYEQYAMSRVDTEDILHKRGPLDLVHPEDIEILKQFFADSDGSKTRAECTLRVKLVTGAYRWCRMIGLYYNDEHGVPTHTIGILIDVDSEHANSVRMTNLLNTVPAGIGIFELDRNGISQSYMNDAFYRLIGAKREDRTQYSGKNVLATVHPKDLDDIKRGLNLLLEGKDSTELDYRIRGGAGNWVWLHLVTSVVERMPDKVRFHVAYYECTERKRQQLQLLQNLRAVALAEQRGNLSIWTYNLDRGVILQQIMPDSVGHMGYSDKIVNVPACFLKSGSVHPEDREKFEETYRRLANGEDKADAIYRLKNQNTGAYDWVHMYYQRMENNDDGERMAVGFSLQVNEQQQAIERFLVEQKLREQMYASAVIYMEYNLTDSVYVGKNNLEDHYRHGRWERPTREEYRENMSSNVEAAYLDEVAEKMYAENLLKAFERGETRVSCEYRSKARPGKPSIWCRVTAVMVKRPDTGAVMAFVYVENAEEDKDRNLAIESSMADGIETVAMIRLADGQTRLILEGGVRLRKQAEVRFVYDDDFVNRSSRVTAPEEREFSRKAALLSAVTERLAKEETYQYTISVIPKSSQRKRKLFRFRYLDDRKAIIVMSVTDITSLYLEEQQQKQQMQDALREAQQASRAKADFYARMSHDMRTPMNGVLGMVELSKGETDSAKLQESMGKIKESGEYLLSLINDTLDLQRIESGKMKLEPTIVSTKALVGNIIDMVSVTAKAKGVALQYSQGNTDLNWYIRADGLRLKQIFINLLSNAIKFTPAGGTVEFEFRLLAREGMLSHDVIYVRDTGIGMSKEFLENGIFKPFSQESNAVSANYAGSGLGLSIAKRLVELMGGSIEVESELGVGTTFAVYLDFERVDEAQAESALQHVISQSKDTSDRLKGKKILLAEDHPLNAEIAKRLLQKVGCDVTWVKNGQVAVSCFANAPAYAFDAILMDIRMPIMDGLEASRQIRALKKEDAATVPILAMTANAYAEDVKASLDAGMNAHLGKPVVPKDLYDALAEYIRPGASKRKADNA